MIPFTSSGRIVANWEPSGEPNHQAAIQAMPLKAKGLQSGALAVTREPVLKRIVVRFGLLGYVGHFELRKINGR